MKKGKIPKRFEKVVIPGDDRHPFWQYFNNLNLPNLAKTTEKCHKSLSQTPFLPSWLNQ